MLLTISIIVGFFIAYLIGAHNAYEQGMHDEYLRERDKSDSTDYELVMYDSKPFIDVR